MKTDTDGIVYLRWPRLDFQSLTCCNPHSVRSASRVAQTSHWCFCSIARPAAPIPPPSPYLAWQEASTASGGWKRQPLTRGPHTPPDCTSGALLQTNSNYRFCFSKSSHTQTLCSNFHTWYSFQTLARRICMLRSLVKNAI